MPVERLLSVCAIVAAALALVACGGAGGLRARTPTLPCTLIGCTSGVYLEARSLPVRAARVQVCVGSRCAEAPATADQMLVALILRHERRERTVRVDVRAFDAAGARLRSWSVRTKLRRSQPNGARCRPVCFGATLELVGLRLRVRSTR